MDVFISKQHAFPGRISRCAEESRGDSYSCWLCCGFLVFLVFLVCFFVCFFVFFLKKNLELQAPAASHVSSVSRPVGKTDVLAGLKAAAAAKSSAPDRSSTSATAPPITRTPVTPQLPPCWVTLYSSHALGCSVHGAGAIPSGTHRQSPR
jgi:hypothetical protein